MGATMLEAVLAVVIGLAAGGLAGLFGIGGGIVMIPAMIFLLGFTQKKAQGTSLAAMLLPIGLPALMNYWRENTVDLRVAALIVAGFLVGSFFSSRVALSLPEDALRRAFAILLVVVALQLWFKR